METVEYQRDRGMGITVYFGKRKGSASTADLSAKAVAETVERFNGFARSGVDEDFHRGDSAYDKYYSDPTVKPNPNLGSIEKPPS